MAKYIGKRIVPVHCGAWDKGRSYEMLSIVLEEPSGDSYISRRDVPAGTAITDTHYWMLHSLFSQQIKDMSDQLAAAEKRIKEDNDETEKNIRSDNDETEASIKADNAATVKAVREDNASTLESVNGRVDAAESAMAEQKASFDAAEGQLNARMDSVLAAGTGDGQTEIADARVDADGIDHGTVGSHIRFLAADQEEKRGALEAKLDSLITVRRTSSNFLDPRRRDAASWDPEAYKYHFHAVSPNLTINGLQQSDLYCFMGNWDIRGLGLSGKPIVCTRNVRFLSFTKTPLKEGDFQRGADDCVCVLTTENPALAETEIQLPEFDEDEFPYMNFTLQGWETLEEFGGTQILYMTEKTPYSAANVDRYSDEVILPRGAAIDDIVAQIRDAEITPGKLSIVRKVMSTNLYDPATQGIYRMWVSGRKWTENSLYYSTGLIRIPDSRKIITNFRFRGMTLYSNDEQTEYGDTPVDGESVCPESTVVANNQTYGEAGVAYDLSGYPEGYQYFRIWLYVSGFEEQNALGWYVADAENYRESLWEDYSQQICFLGMFLVHCSMHRTPT